MKNIFVLFISLSFLLSSCTVLENSLNKRVIMTLTALPSLTPYPTNTPYATYTPYPTITPTPTLLPAAAFVKWNVDQVIQAYQINGAEVGPYRAMLKEDYGAAPQMTLQGICIFIATEPDNCNGRILAFLDQTSLEKTRQFYTDSGFNWLFTNNNILVVINPEISEDTARRYETALAGMQ